MTMKDNQDNRDDDQERIVLDTEDARQGKTAGGGSRRVLLISLLIAIVTLFVIALIMS